MMLSVAICTWNRARLLDQTLGQLSQLRIPDGIRWELLVVDNNCTDETAAVLERHRTHLPIVALKEPKQGHSNARNCAIEAARGDVIIWTDDDVQADPDWLANYAAAFHRHPEAAYFGGLIQPWYEVPPPTWVARNERQLEGMLVIRDLGPVERSFVASTTVERTSETPFGANMAIRTGVQREFRYDPKLGKVKTANIVADETDLFRRIREAGHTGFWVPNAIVRHFVTRERMTTRYLWDYHFGLGRTSVRIDTLVTPWNTPVFRNAPRWLYVKAAKMRLAAFGQWLRGQPAWAVSYARAAVDQGMICEYRSMKWRPPAKENDPTVLAARVNTPARTEVPS